MQADASSPFDTSKGTVYLVLGGGGTNKRDNVYGAQVAHVTTFTQIRTGAKPSLDATEPAAWSAMTDPADAYGVATSGLTRASRAATPRSPSGRRRAGNLPVNAKHGSVPRKRL